MSHAKAFGNKFVVNEYTLIGLKYFFQLIKMYKKKKSYLITKRITNDGMLSRILKKKFD